MRWRRTRPSPDALVRITHKTIKGVTDDMERFRFNTAISKLQVLTNEMRTALDAGAGARSAAEALALLLAPFAPYAAEELWRTVLGHEASVHVASWPSFDPALVADDVVTMVVQVDGKLRDKVQVAVDIDRGPMRWRWPTGARRCPRRSATGRSSRRSSARPSS